MTTIDLLTIVEMFNSCPDVVKLTSFQVFDPCSCLAIFSPVHHQTIGSVLSHATLAAAWSIVLLFKKWRISCSQPNKPIFWTLVSCGNNRKPYFSHCIMRWALYAVYSISKDFLVAVVVFGRRRVVFNRGNLRCAVSTWKIILPWTCSF